jgi:hypothetical protein
LLWRECEIGDKPPMQKAMWTPKYGRDEQRGVDSPIPTQMVSNQDFISRPQTLTNLKTAYRDDGGQRKNATHGWVRAEAS